MVTSVSFVKFNQNLNKKDCGLHLKAGSSPNLEANMPIRLVFSMLLTVAHQTW